MNTSASRAKRTREKPVITVRLECADWRKSVADPVRLAKSAAAAALLHESQQGPLQLTVLLSDDVQLAALNQKFRGKNGPTNVLSFPAADVSKPYIGDIAIAYGICAREAISRGVPVNHHLAHLVVHGVLHLLGYDHETEEQAIVMEPLEAKTLAEMKIPDPYRAQLANS